MSARFICAVWLLWLAFCGGIAGWRTPVTTDLTFFLPRNAGLLDAVLVQQMREGPASRLILIALEGADPPTLAETSRRLADSLRGNPRFETVANATDSALLAPLQQRLFAHRYLLNPDMRPERFTVAALRGELQARLAELATPLGMLQKSWLARDPTGEWAGLLRGWMPSAGPTMRQGVWFSGDGKRALLLARTRASGFDLAAQSAALADIQQRFAEGHPPPALRLIVGGPGALGVEANARITQDATRLSVVNSALVMLLLYAVYRSFRVLGLSLVPLVTGVLSGVAVTSLVFGGIHGITLGFGATLVGVAADYPNHFLTHLQHGERPTAAMARIWPTLRLGLITNVAGFAAMLFSGFAGLAQLAVFAGTGLLAAGLATRWVLPSLAGGAVRLPNWVEQGLPTRQSFRSSRWRGLPALLTAGLTAVFFASATPLWNDDIAALNPVPQEHQRQTEALGRDFGTPDLRQLVLVTAVDADTALRLSETVADELRALERHGALRGFDYAARYLPSRDQQAQSLAALPDPAELARRIAEAMRGLPFKAGVFQPFLDDVAQARQQAPLTRADLTGTPLAERVDSLLFPLREGWAALLPLVGIVDPERIAAQLAPWQTAGVHFVDLRQESTRLMRDYRQEALQLLAGSLVAILAFLVLGLRSLRESVRVLVPVLAAGACTALSVALLFQGLTLYHLVSLLLVMGLSLDQALFFNRDAADPQERRRTLLSLLVCSSSSVLAFGTLAVSAINVLRSIGFTVALGAVLSIGFAALLAQRRPIPR